MKYAFCNLAKRLALAFLLVIGSQTSYAADYTIGVYYYPGWSPYTKGSHEPDPWLAIKAYPEREPLLGWYNDAQRQVLDTQLGWMADYGIDFVTFDWYWEKGRPAPETSVRAYLQSPERARVRYSLLWANHTKEPRTLQEWDALVDYWIGRHLQNPEYVKIQGKPVLFVFSADVIRDQAKIIGLKVAEMLDRAREKAKAAGLPGIYFVLSVPATDYWVQKFAPESGFDALSAYNYHFGLAGNSDQRTPDSHSFEELDSAYQMQWNWIIKNSNLPYFIPMTSGWDKRPWGGSKKDPRHDDSISTPDSFERHLLKARVLLKANPSKTQGVGMVCCWNEYGEGSYVEPTKLYGFEYLKRINMVFGGGK
ncbi:glycoside hydrolase family 99-like domain-containing protein [Aromatoleum evansii]|uniref:glycoside hydrolase family 99-like domain-containing protein n=1 Tax=Aromatoleum evansii TaxID=59406 RepID=UPI00145EE572|nr:glycoside hydrolase family 99-like domain-containing protein [Aromatoleum evansii]NMG29253.1 hypothetical protein [Aromatoleum evansii]